MAGRVAFDTTFLIDLQRERTRGQADGPAHRFLSADPDLEVHLPMPVLGEFAEGFDDVDHPVLRAVRELHVLLPVDEATALTYGQLARELRRRGALIGGNDLWIAATSLRHGLPLVTANVSEFRRVEGLEVVAYR
ncbi:MAG: type II toxin-antitoxin system VapC family toxin [Longimicrobiales bacterium]|nr:type II toxin-antitoxin system VapC family toxin [Longimicrobiales bacterium]